MSETSADDRAFRPREYDYIGLSYAASGALAKLITGPDDGAGTLEETDLRLELGLGLGLTTGFGKREREAEAMDSQASRQGRELSQASKVSGLGSSCSKNWMKRPFAETAIVASLKSANSDAVLQKQNSFWASSNATAPSWKPNNLEISPVKGPSYAALDNGRTTVADGAPLAKDRVVGWPPVRPYRRHTLAKPAEFFVKVNMDGITVGRKVDLNAYNSYGTLRRAVAEMFQPAISGTQTALGREQDKTHCLLGIDQDLVLTYEDKDGDWMLVGDVPWSLFVSTVRRLRITRGAESTGSGSKVPEKTRMKMSD